MNKQNIRASNGDNEDQRSPKSDVWVDNYCEKILRTSRKYMKSEACGRSNISRSIQVARVALQHLCLEDKKLTSLSLSSDAIVSMNY
jgi:hypothetical protein